MKLENSLVLIVALEKPVRLVMELVRLAPVLKFHLIF